ncbi:HD domain-containing protein [Clostridium sp. YIM B02515]|uniref:HD domain-containing protein n=1 Tax=Clostridium rhizosphaerae TaxID=2803861 RepID=A0ABS1TH31_9CLOT|nr:HD domain-containing protein [Clostridium rhizosphaerae]MBL4937253.1 HD domain-containing protein [Clostridium rhizosphaerae]
MKVTYEEILEYTSNLIKENRRERFPFRNRLEHTLRVLKWAERIQKHEGGNMEDLTMAILFHDTGWDENIPHAEISARLVGEYLREKNFDESRLNRIVAIVKKHSSKDIPSEELSLEERIMIDADLLDEVGSLSIVWDSMAVALQDSPSYMKFYERNKFYFKKLKNQTFLMKTETGRRFYDRQIEFLEHFINNLEFELGLRDE